MQSKCSSLTTFELYFCPFFLDNFYDQDNGTQGCICVFSLKNPSYPEYLCQAQSGVICVDIHSDHPHMLAAGLADGNVAVYNLQKNPSKPSYISTARNGKHQDIVWQVQWAKDNLDGYLNFYSVSGDGRVTNWTIVKTALWFTDTLSINFSKGAIINHVDSYRGQKIIKKWAKNGSKMDQKWFENGSMKV